LPLALVLALSAATLDAPPARADDAVVRQRITADDVRVSEEVQKLRTAIRAFESLAHRTALTVLAFRRLSHHSLVVAYTALDLVSVDQAGARRALKRATHAVSASLPILARADRFGARLRVCSEFRSTRSSSEAPASRTTAGVALGLGPTRQPTRARLPSRTE
jgi:hypothetical protein